MCRKSITPVLAFQILLILHISFGKPTKQIPGFNASNTAETETNASLVEIVSGLMLSIPINDTGQADLINSTMEPDYADFNATSTVLGGLEDDLETLGMYLSSSTETSLSSLASLLITDEMEAAGSLVDEAATARMVRDHSSVIDDSSTSLPSTEDDSIIVASMGSSLLQVSAGSPFGDDVVTGATDTRQSFTSDSSNSESSPEFSSENPTSAKEF